MPAKKQHPGKSLVISNNDIVYLWWTYPKKIKDCLGFSIHRIIDGVEEKKGLMAMVGFDMKADPRKAPQTTDEWPIQSFNWKDLYAPSNKKLSYKIIPMVMEHGDWLNLNPDLKNSITTNQIIRSSTHGSLDIVFNRGLLSTQAFTKHKKKTEKSNSKKIIQGAKGLISEVGNVWRKRLAGQMLEKFHEFFSQKGKIYCALYELSDKELINILLKTKDAEIILSSSDSNVDSRVQLHKAMDAGKLKVYDRLMKSNSIGHNKFAVYVNQKGNPVSILTGSTNWTSTGLCGQTNNLVIIKNKLLAQAYLNYWNELLQDTSADGIGLQGADLRTWCHDHPAEVSISSKSKLDVWFSPNTQKKTKPKLIDAAAIPVDMKEVFELIKNAKKQILYLVFNPGNPSIIDHVVKRAVKAKKAGKPIFVRGAVSDAKIAQRVTTNIISKDATLPSDIYKVTGVAAIPGTFSYWEKELLKLGFATIHDKILVIDPFDKKHCAVITGSHNLGLKASYSNDENMLIIKGNTDIAKAYSAHVLDVVNHFRWRYKLQNSIAGKKGSAVKKALSKAWNDLAETDNWMNYYYKQNGDLKREQLLFKP